MHLLAPRGASLALLATSLFAVLLVGGRAAQANDGPTSDEVPATTAPVGEPASQNTPPEVDDSTLDAAFESGSLFDVLEEEESVVIASQKKESVALAASIIGVIDRERIEREGAKTLADMLKTVVGFDTRLGQYNQQQVLLRGYDTPANFLVMVDGHRLNSPYDGGVPFDYPLQNVRRIEIIRGPGSAVYGTNAFVGVINLITFDDSKEISARVWGWTNTTQIRGQHPLSQPLGGAALRGSYDFGPLRLRATGSFIEDKGDALNIPSDNASLRQQPWSLARCVNSSGQPVLDSFGLPILRLPACQAAGGIWNGRTQNAVRRAEGALDVTAGNFRATSRLIFDQRGPGLTSTDTQDLYLAYQSVRRQLGIYTQASYVQALAEHHSLQLRASYDQRNYFERFGQAPAGTIQGGQVHPDGVTTETQRIGRTFYAEATTDHEFQLSSGFAGQATFYFGASYLRRQVDSSGYRANYGNAFEPLGRFVDASDRLPALNQPSTGVPYAECTGGRICTNNRSDNQISGWTQGRWLPKLPVTGMTSAVTAGVRLDYETSRGLVATPRAGLTIAIDERSLTIQSAAVRALIPRSIKLLYGSAFRLPTIRERFDNISQTFFGSPTLVTEHINSLELGIGYKWLSAIELNANAFYSNIENSIQEVYNAGTEPIRQRGTRQVKGVELELRGSYSILADAYVNTTIFAGNENGSDPTTGLAVTSYLEDHARVRFNAGLEFQIYKFIYAGAFGQFTDRRTNRTRSAAERGHVFVMPAYFTMNASIRLKQPVPGLTVAFYGRNITNTNYRDPLSPAHDADVKISAGSQNSDLLPRAGVTFGVELVYAFDVALGLSQSTKKESP